MELVSTTLGQVAMGALLLINIFSFFVMGRDKQKAISGQSDKRTPEGRIFFLAAMFGSIGVYVGMQFFRHKTKTWYFQLGIPLLIFQNLATLYVVLEIVGV